MARVVSRPLDYQNSDSISGSQPATTYGGGDGLVMNRTGTTAQKNALTNVTTGTQWYDTTDSKLYVYNGTTWIAQT